MNTENKKSFKLQILMGTASAATVGLAFIYAYFSRPIPYSQFSLPVLKETASAQKNYSEAQRSIASTAERSAAQHSGSRYAPIPYPTAIPNPTPILSPDNPIKPRASSAQSGDLPLLNLLNFFNLNLINQPTVPEAKCNDGTKPGYYLKKGFGAGANRWIIWLEGGGGCGSADPTNPLWCGLRKQNGGYLSSSNNLPTVFADLSGILSKSEVYNRDFYSYNQVLVHYCSSDFWGGIGVQKEIDQTTHEKFWFSGRKIIDALVLDLKQRYGFAAATNIILTGSSAGGAGITINADEIKTAMPTSDIVTLIDASNFFTFSHFESGLIPESEWNYSVDPQVFIECASFLPMQGNRNCLRRRPQPNCGPLDRCQSTSYECMFPGNAAGYLSMPVFMASDQLDNMILDVYGLNLCTNTNPADYGPWLNQLTTASIAKAKTVSGYFLPRTGDHGLAPTHHWSTAVIENGVQIRLKDVFGAWYFNRTTSPKRFIQSPSTTLYPHQEAYPNGCSASNGRIEFY